MDKHRWEELWEIFHRASELATARRGAFLDAECAGDDDLRRELEGLLDGLETSGDFLQEAMTVPGDLVDGGIPADALVGGRIDVYRIRDVIGEGGMGIVYDAEQEAPVKRRVALKLIKLGMDTREVIARFENERQALALMNHPNIANVLDAGVTGDGRPYFVMEHVAGIPITEYCDKNRLSIPSRLELFILLCQAIEHAHQKGIIHRDIKPSNVMIALQDGQPVPKVIDFGVAKALNQRLTEKTLYTQLGRFIGTPEYMSPEQAESSGLDVDTRTDIYSLGVLLYKLLCGSLPHDAGELTSGDYATVRRTLRHAEPRRPSDRVSGSKLTASERRSDLHALRKQLRGDLDWVVMCALDKDRTRRYQTATEFAADIRRFLRNEPVVASPPGTAYRVKKFVQRHKLGVGMGAVLGLLIAGFTAATTLQSIRLSQALAVADQERQRAQEVSSFLVDLFETTDPAVAKGRDITVREVLDRGAEDLAGDLREQPLLKATLRETIGDVYLALGAYPQSLENLQDALELRRAELGDRHPDVGRAQSGVGRVLAHQGDYDAAAKHYEAALAVQRRAFPDGHAELATSLNEFGFLLMLQGRYEDAEQLQLEGLEMRRALFGERHEEVGLSYNDLAITYRRMSQFDKAERFYRQALDIWRTTFGEDHLQVATVHNNLGVLLHVSGRFDAAEAEFENALAIRRSQLGEGHYYTGLTINNLAGVFIEKGEFEYAEKLYRNATAIHTAAIGPDSPQTISSRSNVARALYEQGKYADAAPMLREVLADRQRVLDPNNPQIATAKTWLARNLVEMGEPEEAGRLAREAVAAQMASLPPGHWRVALAQATLARALSQQGEYAAAEDLLVPGVAVLTEKRGASAQLTLRAIEHLAQIYESTGRPELAAAARSRAAVD